MKSLCVLESIAIMHIIFCVRCSVVPKRYALLVQNMVNLRNSAFTIWMIREHEMSSFREKLTKRQKWILRSWLLAWATPKKWCRILILTLQWVIWLSVNLHSICYMYPHHSSRLTTDRPLELGRTALIRNAFPAEGRILLRSGTQNIKLCLASDCMNAK